ncbi:hypothetical protein NSQ59_27560 [Margalitia sp. FSL K6-0131]
MKKLFMIIMASATIFTLSTNLTKSSTDQTYTTYYISGHNGDVGMGN